MAQYFRLCPATAIATRSCSRGAATEPELCDLNRPKVVTSRLRVQLQNSDNLSGSADMALVAFHVND
jgi:hypothetical protein